MIRAICFDLGETLIHYGRVEVNGILREGAELSYAYLKQRNGEDSLVGFKRYYRATSWALKWHYAWSHVTGREFNAAVLLHRILERLGVRGLGETELGELSWLWYRPLAARARAEEGLAQSLVGLRDRGLKLAIISNTFSPGEVLDRQLKQVGLLEYFGVRVYSSETVVRKPHRRIFSRALEALEVKATEAVMVGDRVGPDIKGGKRMGMRTVLKRGELNARARVGTDVPVIERIKELGALVDEWNAG